MLIGASSVPGIGDTGMNMPDLINPSESSVCRATPNEMKAFKNHDDVKRKHGRDTD